MAQVLTDETYPPKRGSVWHPETLRRRATNLGFAVSSDQGPTWTSGTLPSTTIYSAPPGPYQWVSYPRVNYDLKRGDWLISGIGGFGSEGTDAFVSRSSNGKTWDGPIVFDHLDSNGQGGLPGVGCDNTPASPWFGNCYATWDDAYTPVMFVSTDGGLTWQPSTLPRFPEGTGGIPLVQPNGRVVVLLDGQSIYPCCVLISRDGGVSYDWRRVVDLRFYYHNPAGNLRALDYPSADMDAQGQIYAVWYSCWSLSNCYANDIVLATSRDGWHWPAFRRIPIDAPTSSADHFTAGIAVEPGTSGDSAHLAVIFWSYRDAACTEVGERACELSVAVIESQDGGTTWGRTNAPGRSLSQHMASTHQWWPHGR